MKVAHIKIHNILGIEDFEITPKEINRFEGKNATGKTSTLEAIRAALKGGHDATLLRKGAEDGEIIILLDDGLEIKKTIKSDKTDLTVKYPKSGIKVDKAQTHLNALVDALSVNPVEFLTAPAKSRTEYLLQAMPLKVTREDLKGIFDSPFDPTAHAFTTLALIDKILYDDRTGVNRLADEKKKTAKQLGETLPLEEEGKARTDWAKLVKDTTQELAETRSNLKSAREKTDRAHDERARILVDACAKQMTAINTEWQQKLAELNKWKGDQQAAAQAIEKDALAAEEKVYATELKDAESNLSEKIANLTGRLAEAETKAKQQIKDNATRDTINRVNDEALKHKLDSDLLTSKLEALNALRLRILSNLPIPGLTVEDGEIKKDGITYDRLNTASQIDIAVAIAKIRAKDLGIVCVDGLECLDEENFQAFEKAMQGTGLQCFITRVTNTPMAVTVK